MQEGREKVIKGLELCRYDPDPGMPLKSEVSCDICPYWDDTYGCRMNDMFDDAIALLKAQEPRVMTLDEAASAELVWYEWRTIGARPAKVNRVPSKTGTYRIQRFGDIDGWDHADEYGECWRCWDKRPTEEQRRDTPWE